MWPIMLLGWFFETKIERMNERIKTNLKFYKELAECVPVTATFKSV